MDEEIYSFSISHYIILIIIICNLNKKNKKNKKTFNIKFFMSINTTKLLQYDEPVFI